MEKAGGGLNLSNKIELEIKSLQSRSEVGRILLENGYRVWTEVRKGSGSTKVTILCADKGGKEGAV